MFRALVLHTDEAGFRAGIESLDDGRLPALARLRRYDLELIVDPAQPTFAGIVSFDLDLPEPTAHIVLHARDLTITEAHVERARTVFPATTAVRLAHGARITCDNQ